MWAKKKKCTDTPRQKPWDWRHCQLEIMLTEVSPAALTFHYHTSVMRSPDYWYLMHWTSPAWFVVCCALLNSMSWCDYTTRLHSRWERSTVCPLSCPQFSEKIMANHDYDVLNFSSIVYSFWCSAKLNRMVWPHSQVTQQMLTQQSFFINWQQFSEKNYKLLWINFV